ncbi:TonB-dependent receptor [Phenylobacterium sp.]|uniref:TonB-dependent receptor domain-containing protein n=1 Tax=Phenylobacterium sp. TaxID=1871053 RepID=UPI0025F4E523|nr:TonB-dependent receptor [Phenylobacterium sp.]MBX3485454.1 TonB-dependent receptor [Phenylobacterium sp.]
MIRLHFICASSAVALLTALPGLAQAQTENDATVGELVVTGSRIQATGFQQPTPVTVVGSADIQKSMTTTVANYLNQLPSFGAPTSSANPNVGASGGGLSLLNLRGLGSARTLVLLDNRRVVNSSVSSGVDTNTLPTTLLSRVEVVTGGASAAWGADAISGVVNFVLNHNYEGFEVSYQGGATEEKDNTTGKIDVTYGTKFAGGRGSFVAAGTYSFSPEIVRTGDRKRADGGWWHYAAVVNNPSYTPTNGQPRLITVPEAGEVNVWRGSVITSGPLRGTAFFGPSGNVGVFDFGRVSTVLQVGGTLEQTMVQERNLTNGLNYSNLFAHVRYDLTDRITAYAEASYGRSDVRQDSLHYSRGGNLTVSVNNPYLPTVVRDQLVAAGQTSFSVARANTEPGLTGATNRRELTRVVIGLDGRLGDWKWGAYYQRGEVNVLTRMFSNASVPRYNFAVNAVRDAAGAIVCAPLPATASANDRLLYQGCQPFNIFGDGAPSQAAVDYVFGTRPYQEIRLKQDFVSFEASGPLFTLPAGQVTAAFGGDYSREIAHSDQDEQSRLRTYNAGNFQPFDGKVAFKELFAEVNVPLLADLPLARRLEVNAAGRLTDYNTSGTVYTWKVGVSNQITDDLRLRVTRSRDIRAPSQANLFTLGLFSAINVFDPLTQRAVNVSGNSRGNPDLKPEEADTWTIGLVYRPEWIPGLAASIDFYDIRIKGAIATLTTQQTVDLCFGTRPELCSLIFRNPDNSIRQVDLIPTNADLLTAMGVDYEVSYRRPIFKGALDARLLVSNQQELNGTNVSGVRQKYAGSIANEFPGLPKWKGQLSVGYEQGPLNVATTMRYVGDAKLRNEWQEGVDVDDNHVAAIAYFDLRASYDFAVRGVEMRASLNIDNLFDTDPRIVPATPGLVQYARSWAATRIDLYDALGRSYRVGLRARF